MVEPSGASDQHPEKKKNQNLDLFMCTGKLSLVHCGTIQSLCLYLDTVTAFWEKTIQ